MSDYRWGKSAVSRAFEEVTKGKVLCGKASVYTRTCSDAFGWALQRITCHMGYITRLNLLLHRHFSESGKAQLCEPTVLDAGDVNIL